MKKILLLTLLLLVKMAAFAQARIEIQNKSQRYMTVKVMRANGGQGKLFKTVSISPYASTTVYFTSSGQYFTKTKALLSGKSPVCKKGNAFRVVNDDTGYSVLTLTFSISESAVNLASGGRSISEAEFNAN